jgi:hypothetical protein
MHSFSGTRPVSEAGLLWVSGPQQFRPLLRLGRRCLKGHSAHGPGGQGVEKLPGPVREQLLYYVDKEGDGAQTEDEVL